MPLERSTWKTVVPAAVMQVESSAFDVTFSGTVIVLSPRKRFCPLKIWGVRLRSATFEERRASFSVPRVICDASMFVMDEPSPPRTAWRTVGDEAIRLSGAIWVKVTPFVESQTRRKRSPPPNSAPVNATVMFGIVVSPSITSKRPPETLT